jgi:hypothetical protein
MGEDWREIMTEKVTIKDLTCKTCTRKKIQDQEGDILISWYCIALKMEMGRDPDMDDDDLTIMDRCGCAHHPLTLQVLAGPVIAELENMKTNAHKRMNACLDLGNDGNWQGGKEEAFEEAIKLLKEGVKKP